MPRAGARDRDSSLRALDRTHGNEVKSLFLSCTGPYLQLLFVELYNVFCFCKNKKFVEVDTETSPGAGAPGCARCARVATWRASARPPQTPQEQACNGRACAA